MPLRQSLAPQRSIDAVLKREGGRCQECGALATTIDHITTGCNRPINLRAVCDNCCKDHPFGDPAVLEKPEFDELLAELVTRIGAPSPLQCCDDVEGWDWRAYLKERSV